ncbi:hypothetical protein [Pseudacidovorax intermedius]|uniref:hypothetical protein n=1 Tax=Pseudacidovorax intermedius TaxID=433924 RepID=UPI0026E9250E|nr:hypothetical protein [Pseudacidovorax intermedius]
MTIRILNVGTHRMQLMPTLRAGRVGYSVRVLKAKPRSVVRLSAASESTFRKISDPANAHLFTAEAALAAFADIDV